MRIMISIGNKITVRRTIVTRTAIATGPAGERFAATLLPFVAGWRHPAIDWDGVKEL